MVKRVNSELSSIQPQFLGITYRGDGARTAAHELHQELSTRLKMGIAAPRETDDERAPLGIEEICVEILLSLAKEALKDVAEALRRFLKRLRKSPKTTSSTGNIDIKININIVVKQNANDPGRWFALPRDGSWDPELASIKTYITQMHSGQLDEETHSSSV
jgi:hypothetical protein